MPECKRLFYPSEKTTDLPAYGGDEADLKKQREI
jgi:hypothetical protein